MTTATKSDRMNIIIHRGTDEIGGSCIEIVTGQSRLILDLGLPIMEHGGGKLDPTKTRIPSISNGILPNVQGLYRDDQPTVTGVVLSHCHMDHYGLMDFIHPDIPIYVSKGTQRILEAGNVFFPENLKQNRMMLHLKQFEFWKPFSIGPFKIFAYLMDHSAFDAASILIEAEGKKVFYSGDLRAHGRKSGLFQKIIDKPPEGIDCLLMEGTTIGGNHELGYKTEQDVEDKFSKIFAEQKDVSFVMSAGSNIDRTVSLYKAALRTKKYLVLDLYQYFLLEQLKNSAPNLPPFKDDHIKVFYSYSQAKKMAEKFGEKSLYPMKNRHFKRDDILKHRKNCVVAISMYEMKKIAENLHHAAPLKDARFVFSMWQGYLKLQKEFEEFYKGYGMGFEIVHCSGHAYLEDLKKLTGALKPKKLIPIHTLNADAYCKYFKNVVRVNNGDSLSI